MKLRNDKRAEEHGRGIEQQTNLWKSSSIMKENLTKKQGGDQIIVRS